MSLVAFNTWPQVLDCVEAICDSGLSDYEILIWNNGAVFDGPKTALHGADIINSPRNVGFGAGHNANLERASFDTFLILNPDTLPGREALEGLRDTLTDRRIAAASCLLAGPDGEVQTPARRLPSLATEAGRVAGLDQLAGSPFSTLMRITAGPGHVETPQPAGAVIAARTADLREIGGFDTGFAMYFEDVDLCRRLARLGRIVTLTSVFVEHEGEGTAKSYRRETTFWIEYSRRRYFRKYCTGLRLALFVLFGLAGAATHLAANVGRALVARQPDSRREALSKAAGYAMSLEAAAHGDDRYWRERMLP